LANGFFFVEGNEDVAVLLGKGDGTFLTADRYWDQEHQRYPTDVVVADFDGDRILDVAAVNASSQETSETVAVLLGIGDGTLAAATYFDVPELGWWPTICSGDLNGDGSEDVIMPTATSIAVLLNNGDGTLGVPIEVATTGVPSAVTVADFNMDGRPDIAAVIQGERPNESVLDILINTTPGDANRDGRFNQKDIVIVLQANTYLTGKPASWSEGDWDGDGVFDQIDIVAAQQAGLYLK
jgi:hypothetical protein